MMTCFEKNYAFFFIWTDPFFAKSTRPLAEVAGNFCILLCYHTNRRHLLNYCIWMIKTVSKSLVLTDHLKVHRCRIGSKRTAIFQTTTKKVLQSNSNNKRWILQIFSCHFVIRKITIKKIVVSCEKI